MTGRKGEWRIGLEVELVGERSVRTGGQREANTGRVTVVER